MARGTVAALAFVGLGSLQETRWPEAFRSADSSRTRVEVLYGAGDLPGALQEALAGLRVPFSRNCVLCVRRDADPPAPESEELGRTFSVLALPGAARWFDPGSTPVLTDDHNPIDALQRRSVEEGRKLWLGAP